MFDTSTPSLSQDFQRIQGIFGNPASSYVTMGKINMGRYVWDLVVLQESGRLIKAEVMEYISFQAGFPVCSHTLQLCCPATNTW